MNPMDGYLYNEFLDPNMEYECPNCGASFGEEEVFLDDATQQQFAICPDCGKQLAIDD